MVYLYMLCLEKTTKGKVAPKKGPVLEKLRGFLLILPIPSQYLCSLGINPILYGQQ